MRHDDGIPPKLTGNCRRNDSLGTEPLQQSPTRNEENCHPGSKLKTATVLASTNSVVAFRFRVRKRKAAASTALSAYAVTLAARAVGKIAKSSTCKLIIVNRMGLALVKSPVVPDTSSHRKLALRSVHQ